MKSDVVVTGAAGFIGSHLCDCLLAQGYFVIGIDSFEDYYSPAIKRLNIAAAQANPRFAFLERDVIDPSLEEILREAKCVYHLAAQAGVRGSWGSSFDSYVRNNVLATQRLLEACVRVGVAKFVYASSSSVYGDQDELPLHESILPRPHSPYGVTKLAGEHLSLLYAANYGLNVTALRFFSVYGPRQRPDMAFHRSITSLSNGREITIYGDGAQTRDFTYAADVVQGLMNASSGPSGSVMNIGGGKRVTLLDAISVLSHVTGILPKIQRKRKEAGDVSGTWADIDCARRTINYEPKTDLEAGLRQQYLWLLQCQDSALHSK